jgi:hypothetical protein
MSRALSQFSNSQLNQSQQHFGDEKENNNQSVLNNFDFTAIEEMDPSLGKYIGLFNVCE